MARRSARPPGLPATRTGRRTPRRLEQDEEAALGLAIEDVHKDDRGGVLEYLAAALRERHRVSGLVRRSDGALVRVVAEEPPAPGARPATPTLEDAYLLHMDRARAGAGFGLRGLVAGRWDIVAGWLAVAALARRQRLALG